MYLAGVTAAHVSRSGKLGFQGGFQIPQLMRSVNAFTLGAQSVNPKTTTTVVWNGGWWEPQKETEATNAFADLGIDVIAEQVDSPITIAQAAEKRGIFMIVKDIDIHDRAPKAMLTGVSWDWGPMMVEEIKAIKAGAWKSSNLRGDLASGNVVLDPFGAAVPEDVRKEVLALKADIIAGKKSQQVETMDYLVKGIVGATK
jgi:basic membrane protein A and related proteins